MYTITTKDRGLQKMAFHLHYVSRGFFLALTTRRCSCNSRLGGRFFPIRNLLRSSWGIRPQLGWDMANLCARLYGIHPPYRLVLSNRIARCNRSGRLCCTRRQLQPKTCQLVQNSSRFVCKWLTAKSDIDVIESNVDAQFGDYFLVGEGAVTARDLPFPGVPSASVAGNWK